MIRNINYVISGFVFLFLSLNVFAQAPVINSFSPLSGNTGSPVIISGSNFSTTPENNIVFFGAVRGVVTSVSSTSITVTVPAGATNAAISVNTNGKTAFSILKFYPAFSGPNAITENSFQLNMNTGFSHPNSIAISDIDGDGKPDVGFSEIGDMFTMSDTISILKNTSTVDSIMFGFKFKIEIPSDPTNKANVYFKDLDGDARPDIIFLKSGSFSVYRNTSVPGTISFAPKQDFNLGGETGKIAAFGDFNLDGRTDISIVTKEGSLFLFQNSSSIGAMNLAVAESFPRPLGSGGPQVSFLSLEDLDGDHRPEIIYLDQWWFEMHILRNTSTINPAFTEISFPEFDVVTNVAGIADVDGDQKLDIVTSEFLPFIKVFVNTSAAPGTISFQPTVVLSDFLNSGAVYDIDADGKPDFIAGTDENHISIQKNTSTAGNFSFEPKVIIATSPNPLIATRQKDFCDFNLDGRPDILLINGGDFTTSFAILANIMGKPEITSFTPTHGDEGTTVTISGYNFNNTTSVSFGGIPANLFEVISSTEIAAIAPADASGKIKVVTPYGSDSLGAFNSPSIRSFTPHYAGQGIDQYEVIIKGINFTGTDAVSFGGIAASNFVVTADTLITATVSDNGAAGYVNVRNAYGADSAAGFIYANAMVTELCPPFGNGSMITNVFITNGTYQWQVSILGNPFQDINNNGFYLDYQTPTMQLVGIPPVFTTNRYRCVARNPNNGYTAASTINIIKFTDYWTGQVSTAWEDPANWSCGAIPDENTDVILNSGAVLILSSNTSIRSLMINPGASLTIADGYHLTILH